MGTSPPPSRNYYCKMGDLFSLVCVLIIQPHGAKEIRHTERRLTNGMTAAVRNWPPRNIHFVRNWSSTSIDKEDIMAELVEPPLPPYLEWREDKSVHIVKDQHQLFVDNYLVDETTMKRVYFRPKLENSGQPVQKPVALGHDPPNIPYPGGLHRCSASNGEFEFRLFWHEYKKDRVELAISRDLVQWTRHPSTSIAAGGGTERVPCLSLNDAWTFMTPDGCQTFYAFAKSCPRLGPGVIFKLNANGTSWERVAETGKTHDRASFWWNPLIGSWVFNLRLDFTGYARSIWYWEASHPLSSKNLGWDIPDKWRGNFCPRDWRRELESDWAKADSLQRSNKTIPAGMQAGIRLPVPFIAADARDQRNLPNYNNNLVSLEGDCTPRTCGATHRSACVRYRASYLRWIESQGETPQFSPPPIPKELLPRRCVRLTDVYAVEVVPYESVLVGLHAIWQGGMTGNLKHMQIWTGYSRDGFYFYRPDIPWKSSSSYDHLDPSARGTEQAAFIRYPGEGWRNCQPVANGIATLNNRTYFLFTARHRSLKISGIFLSSLRRDGFASMRCESTDRHCTLTTVPFEVNEFGGNLVLSLSLHVNVDARSGRLVIDLMYTDDTKNTGKKTNEIWERNGRATSEEIIGDHTNALVSWKVDTSRSKYTSKAGKIQLRFTATGHVDIYSFWFEEVV